MLQPLPTIHWFTCAPAQEEEEEEEEEEGEEEKEEKEEKLGAPLLSLFGIL